MGLSFQAGRTDEAGWIVVIDIGPKRVWPADSSPTRKLERWHFEVEWTGKLELFWCDRKTENYGGW